MLCIDASGRGVNGDPESRLEPDRIESLRNDLPTQYPEDPIIVGRTKSSQER